MAYHARVICSTGNRALAPAWVPRGRQKLPERTETSLTLFVKLKWHVIVLDLFCRRADGQLDEGAAIQAEPAGAFLQDLPPFVGDADGQVGFVHLVHRVNSRAML